MLAQMLTLVPKVCPPTTADAHHEMVSIRAFWSMPAESLSTSSTVRRLLSILACQPCCRGQSLQETAPFVY